MPPSTLTIASLTLHTYTVLIAAAILSGLAWMLRGVTDGRRGAWVDVCIGGLVVGLVVARGLHVLLNWGYFAYNTAEIPQLRAGGLDWHGALLGGLVGMTLVARWRGVHLSALLDRLTPVLPLVALAGWWGCWSAGCAYGQEVATLADYPAFLVWEGPDIFGIYAPRFNLHPLGMALSLGLLIVAALLMRVPVLRGQRVWIVVVLLSLLMFALGFLRGDYAVFVAGLRLDQWLDLSMIALAAGMLATGSIWFRCRCRF